MMTIGSGSGSARVVRPSHVCDAECADVPPCSDAAVCCASLCLRGATEPPCSLNPRLWSHKKICRFLHLNAHNVFFSAFRFACPSFARRDPGCILKSVDVASEITALFFFNDYFMASVGYELMLFGC